MSARICNPRECVNPPFRYGKFAGRRTSGMPNRRLRTVLQATGVGRFCFELQYHFTKGYRFRNG